MPVPANANLLRALVPLGTRPVALHLLDATAAPELKDPKEIRVKQAPQRSAPSAGRVAISAHRWFEGAPERV